MSWLNFAQRFVKTLLLIPFEFLKSTLSSILIGRVAVVSNRLASFGQRLAKIDNSPVFGRSVNMNDRASGTDRCRGS